MSRPAIRFRLAAALVAVALLATACSGVPNLIDGSPSTVALEGSGTVPALGADGGDPLVAGDSMTSGPSGANDGLAPGSPGSSGAPGSGTTVPSGSPGTGGAGGANGTTPAGTAGAGGPAPAGTVDGPAAPAAAGGHGPGVTDKEILVVFHRKMERCGSDPQTQGDGVVNDSFYDRLETYMKWFNKYVEYPGGRKLVYKLVDDGGTDVACIDKARAGGLQIAKEIRPLAALGNSINIGADLPVLADVVTRAGIMHIGTNFQTHADAKARHPYAWSSFATAEDSFSDLGVFLDTRIKHTPYRSDVGVESDRVYGALVEDSNQGRQVLSLIERAMQGAGLQFKPYFLSPDVSTASRQGASLAAQMSSDGVNSLVFAVLGRPAVAAMKAFEGQAFNPDFLISDYGGFTIAFFTTLLAGPQQIKRFIAAGGPCIVCHRNELDLTDTSEKGCPSCHMQENGSAYVEAYHQAGGTAANPQDGGWAFDMWTQLAILSIGILNGTANGEPINAQNIARGLGMTGQEDRCDVQRFFGRDHPQVTRTGFFNGGYQFGSHGFTTLYGTDKRSKLGTLGYFESFDGYYRFDAANPLPPKPTYDTGQKGDYPYNKHKDTGLKVDKPC